LPFAYAGTHLFGALVLEELLDRQAPIVAVITRPDKPRGRHGTPQPSDVKESALAHGLPVLQPERMAGGLARELSSMGAEALAVCAHGAIVPQEFLDELLSVVTHPSAVPRWRGAAPVERALMNGETELAVATLRMTAGVDEGPVGDLRPVHVPPEADAGQAYALLAPPAAEGLLATLAAIEGGRVHWRPQEGEPTYARKIEKGDRELRWGEPAARVVDRVRALSPAVGARTQIGGRELTVWRARALSEAPEPAPDSAHTLDRLIVPAAEGWVELLEVQAPGGRRLPAAEYLRGAGRWLTRL
jgi:methionyl-tRNA formyltransferase